MTHHAPEEMLLEYVAGTSTDAAALSTACHVALCGACAARVAELEAVGGGFLDAGGGPAGARHRRRCPRAGRCARHWAPDGRTAAHR